VSKKKKSLGRDAFEELVDKEESQALKQLISGEGLKVYSGTREVEIITRLTPANIRQLDELQKQLAEKGKGYFSRDQLIRIAIALLSFEEF
jgi:hypothetical protein